MDPGVRLAVVAAQLGEELLVVIDAGGRCVERGQGINETPRGGRVPVIDDPDGRMARRSRADTCRSTPVSRGARSTTVAGTKLSTGVLTAVGRSAMRPINRLHCHR